MKLLPVVCIVGIGFLLSPSVADQRSPAPVAADLDALVTRTFNAWNVPGASVAVVKDGQVTLAKGWGVRHAGRPEPVTETTVFYTASVTKTFTVAALGLLADEGRLRIDDLVTKYLPGFSAGGADLARQLTLRDLMSHRTGLPRADLLMFSGLSPDDVLGRLAGLAPVAPVRSRFTYSNQMYLALGEVIARLSGRTWRQFVETRLLTPLGMAGSNAAGLGHPVDEGGGARPHALVAGAVAPIDYIARAPYGAGGINTTARDLARWLQFQLGDGTWAGAKLANPQVIQAPQQPNSIGQPVVWTPDANFVMYGLGWFLNDYHGRKVVQHAGNGEGWTALAWMIPQEKLGIVVLTNMHGTLLPWAIAHGIADAYQPGVTPRDWAQHFRTTETARDAAIAKQLPAPTTDPVDASRWLGTWTSPIYGDLTIAKVETGLEVRYGVDLRARLQPFRDGGLVAMWRRSDILAVIGPSALRLATRDGRERLALTLGGDTVEFTRDR